jgi:hypothetical protein
MWNGSSTARKLLWTLGVGFSLSALPGCFAHTRGEVVYDYPVTYVEEPPPRVEYYPHTVYHGRPAYLVDGRWYYQNDRRWVYFQDEPRELRDYRVRRGPAYANPPNRYSSRDGRNDRYGQHRAAERRAEDRQIAERRAAERRAAERRADEHRMAERRAAERRADEHRVEERRAQAKRDERRGRVAEHPRDNRRRPRNDRDDDRDQRRRD